MSLRNLAAAASLLMALLPAVTNAQDKIRLTEAIAPGDVDTAEHNIEMTAELHVRQGELEAPGFNITRREYERATFTILAVMKRKPTGVRGTFEIARRTETGPTGATKTTVLSRQGKTITIRRTANGVTVTPSSGRLSAEDIQDLKHSLDADTGVFFPAQPIAVGDNWHRAMSKPAEVFAEARKAVVDGTFLEIVTYRGHECAHLKLDVAVEGKTAEGIGLTATLSGDLYHALDLHRTLHVDLDGPVTLQGQQMRQGQKLIFSGDGTMHLVVDDKWSAVAGKPVK